MEREVSRLTALVVIAAFTLFALAIGTKDWISEEMRVALAFPVMVAGLLVSLKEITTRASITWETVASALLAVGGSVLLGYQAIANAKGQSILAGIIVSAAIIGMAFLVPLALNFFLRKPK